MAKEKRYDEMAWANIRTIKSNKDAEYVKDVLKARRDFLDLRSRHELGIRKIYIDAADRVADRLRNLPPTTGKLTRNHLTALEKELRKEADKITKSTEALIKTGIEKAVSLGATPVDNQLIRAIQQAGVKAVDIAKLQKGFADINSSAVEALWTRTKNGLRISRRIWNHSQEAKEAMMNLIQTGVAAGRDAVAVARDLERYVRNGAKTLAGDYPNMMARMGKRVPKNLSYEALRLARTEYSNAFFEGVYSRGRINPSYLGVRWLLSDAHVVPDVCDELANADLYKMGKGVYAFGEEPPIPHPNCYDEQTEVYTNEGWKHFKDLTGNEMILSLNPETLMLEWSRYIAKVAYHYAGEMVSFKSHDFDMLVTPDHRMFIGRGIRWGIEKAINLHEGSVFRIPRTAGWVGEEPKTINYGGLEFKPEVFCRFMAYYLSDGCTTKRYNNCYQICIAKTGVGKDEIVKDLMEMPIKVDVGQAIYMYHSELGEELIKLGKSYQKSIPDIIKRLSPRLINVFLDAFRFCDGHERTSKWKEAKLQSFERVYFTTSKKMADELGELILKAGYYPSFSIQKSAGRKQKFKNGVYTINHDIWTIRQNRSKCAWYHKTEKKGIETQLVPYEGMVYDVQLDINHVLWVRRNGKTAWSGNCMCYVVPHLQDTAQFVDRLVEWQKNPKADKELNEWYNKIYKKM